MKSVPPVFFQGLAPNGITGPPIPFSFSKEVRHGCPGSRETGSQGGPSACPEVRPALEATTWLEVLEFWFVGDFPTLYRQKWFPSEGSQSHWGTPWPGRQTKHFSIGGASPMAHITP